VRVAKKVVFKSGGSWESILRLGTPTVYPPRYFFTWENTFPTANAVKKRKVNCMEKGAKSHPPRK